MSYINIQIVYNWSITHSQHSREKMKNLFSHTALCPQMIPIWTRKIHHCSFRTICQTKTIQNCQNYSVGLNQEFLLFSPILWSVVLSSHPPASLAVSSPEFISTWILDLLSIQRQLQSHAFPHRETLKLFPLKLSFLLSVMTTKLP